MEIIIWIVCIIMYLKLGSFFKLAGEFSLPVHLLFRIFWLPIFLFSFILLRVQKNGTVIGFDEKGRIKLVNKEDILHETNRKKETETDWPSSEEAAGLREQWETGELFKKEKQ
ncbi:hypothetical protein LIT25_14885 [Bacillus sp. F19]|nr:hypothetical protein LIT25_14885 [Bacillus sp. F19]